MWVSGAPASVHALRNCFFVLRHCFFQLSNALEVLRTTVQRLRLNFLPEMVGSPACGPRMLPYGPHTQQHKSNALRTARTQPAARGVGRTLGIGTFVLMHDAI